MITEHFSIAEFTRSQTADRLGLDNEPMDRQWSIISGLCSDVLEPAREVFGPIGITSGFRSRALNDALPGASKKSDHMVEGRSAAADIVHATLGDLYRWIYIQLPWSRLIWEYSRWIHVSWCADGRPEGRRPQVKRSGEQYRPLSFEEIVRLGKG